MRPSFFRALCLAAFIVAGTTAHAGTNATAREPRAAAVVSAASVTPEWMTGVLMGTFDRAAAPAPVEMSQPLASPENRSARPHQNPAFPAAFVFQSNSALFLAAEASAHSAHRPIAG